MANIIVKDLANIIDIGANSDSFIHELSESELSLQGGKKHKPTPTQIVISDTPFIPPDIQTLDLSNILLGFAPYSIF
jgi:hypothetical protein